MARIKGKNSNEIILLEAGYLLKDIFEDNYEYEEYFRSISGVAIAEHCPEVIKVELSSAINSVQLKFPRDNDDTLIVMVPCSKKMTSPNKRSELRERNIKKYAGLIQKIKIEVKDELAMRRRALVNSKDKAALDSLAHRQRAAGQRRLKKELQRSNRSKN